MSASADDCGQGAVRALPALVAIHGVVPATHRGDALAGQLREVLDRRVRGDVPSVRERMDPRLLRRETKQRTQVVDVRVNPAVGDETQQVDALPTIERRAKRLVLEERPVL